MAAFLSIPTSQQTLISSFVQNTLRPMVRASNQALGQLGAMASGVYGPTIAPILAGIDGTEVIPDNTGLAGAQPVTVAEVLAYMTALEALLAAYATPQQVATYNAIGGI